MAATLQDILLAPETRPHVIADCQKLIEQDVLERGGHGGFVSSWLGVF